MSCNFLTRKFFSTYSRRPVQQSTNYFGCGSSARRGSSHIRHSPNAHQQHQFNRACRPTSSLKRSTAKSLNGFNSTTSQSGGGYQRMCNFKNHKLWRFCTKPSTTFDFLPKAETMAFFTLYCYFLELLLKIATSKMQPTFAQNIS